jgi:AmmeMemoRadiSam system protein B
MQLPFLQHLVPGLRIVPLLMGQPGAPEVDALRRALGRRLRGP